MRRGAAYRWRDAMAFVLALHLELGAPTAQVEAELTVLVSSVAVATSGAEPRPLSGAWS